MDETEAIAELRCLSENAKRWIEDRVGNYCNTTVGLSTIGMAHKIPDHAERMIGDFQRIGCFTLQGLRGYGQRKEG